MTENLRDKDWVVLNCIHAGQDDTQKITQATTLESSEVRYSLKKLDTLDLIDLEKPDGMVERVVNGQKRVFKAPFEARLTDHGATVLASTDEAGEQYERLSHDELVTRVHELEDRLQDLEHSFEIFRRQIQRHLNSE